MTTFLCARLPVALLALLLLASSGSASAAAYGYSYTSVFGLVISNPSGSVSLLSNIDLSRTTATLNGSSIINGSSNEIDAPQAARGAVTKGENDFTRQGMGNASYARGEAQIVTSQIPPFHRARPAHIPSTRQKPSWRAAAAPTPRDAMVPAPR